MSCKLCDNDISGQCHHCGGSAPRYKHYCDNALYIAKLNWEGRPTHGEWSNFSPKLKRDWIEIVEDARAVLEDRVPLDKQICDECADTKIDF